MNVFAVSGIAIMATTAMIGIAVYFFSKDRPVAKIFAIFNIFVFIWGLGSFKIGTTTTYETSHFWWRVSAIGIIWIPIAFFHFVCVFLKIKKKLISAFADTFASICTLTVIFKGGRYFIGNLKFIFGQFYWKSAFPLLQIAFFVIIYLGLLGYSFFLLIKGMHRATGLRRTQIKYFLISSVVGWMGAELDYLLGFGIIDIYPYHNFLISIYPLITGYAILRHRLMDIEVIIKKTLVFAGLFAFVYAAFIGMSLFTQGLFQNIIGTNRWIAMLPSALIVIFALRPLEAFLVNATDKYLFQKKYDYKELLKTFAGEVLTVLDLQKLINLTEGKLVDIIKISSAEVLLFDENKQEKLDGIDKLSAELIIPLVLHNEVIGKLSLGKKKSDENYTQDDLDILLPLARTLAIAISNAKLFDELSKTQVLAAQRERMATIGTFAAGMAHEIRNPITTMRIFSEYFPDKFKEDAFREKYRDIIIKEVDKIDHIIETLIDFSGEAMPDAIEGVSAKEAIDELISLMSTDSGTSTGIEFINDAPPALPRIRVNRKEFDEILLNIIQNAIHAIPTKGQISFSASKKDNFIELKIQDTGCGMSEDILKHLFSPFFTTRSKGFGLGLFVVKELVLRNKGSIHIESKIGQGTRFTLEFVTAEALD